MKCNQPMKIYNCQQTRDHFQWRCRSCNTRKSIRVNSFFRYSKLPLQKLLELIYWWTTDAKLSIVVRETGISHTTVIDWFSFIKEVCFVWVDDMSEPIGGFDTISNSPRIVEVDESCFMRRKYNRGKKSKQHWVFGGDY